MAAVRGPNKRSLAFVVALTLLLSFVVPFVGTALAGHSTADNTHDLQVDPETDSNPTGTTHTLTATVTPGDGVSEVDFEIESGGTARVNCTPQANFTCTGGTANSDADRTTPDMTCTTTAGNQASDSCQVFFTSDSPGTFVIRAWVDEDGDNATVDADLTEGADASDTADEVAGGTNEPGSRTEVDDTDVVTKTFFTDVSANARLDCTPETATNPSTGANSSETYTCTAVDTKGTVATTDDTPVTGFTLDAEIISGDTAPPANDPDNGNVTPADFNNCGTLDSNGSATCTITAAEAQAGTVNICIWIDGDNDTASAGTVPNDGSECGEGLAAGDETSETGNQTDVVEKVWRQAGQADTIDCTPESDQNIKGSQHTVTCTVTDAFGTPVQGASVDFTVTGRNATTSDNRSSDANGQVTFTYTDTTAALASEGQSDTITGCIDPDTGAGCATPEAPSSESTEAGEDTVQKFWFTSEPTTNAIVLDMEDTSPCTDVPAAADNQVGTTHQVCAKVTNASNAPIPGEPVTFTLSGPGTFVDPSSGTNDAVTCDETKRGTSITVASDSNGEAFATICSEQTGTSTVTAASDGKTDTGTKKWFGGRGRVLDCTPEAATNQAGTEHVVTCTMKDRFGNGTQDADGDGDVDGADTITVSESGPGTLVSPTAPTAPNASGVVEVRVRTAAGETGTQTITAEVTADVGDTDVAATDTGEECDKAAGNPTGTTAGACEDDVTKTWQTGPVVTTPPGGFPRSITLEASKNRVVYGNQVTLTASVSAGSTDTPASCISGVTVTFSRTVVGESGSETVDTATTDSNGEASIDLAGDRSAVYTASVDQTSQCAQAASNPESVLVKKKVKLRVSDQTPRRGTIVRFRVTVLPCGGADGPGHEGDRVQLYKTVGGQLAKIDAKRTNDECKATFKRRARGENTYQARSPKQDADHLGGKSRKKAVIAH